MVSRDGWFQRDLANKESLLTAVHVTQTTLSRIKKQGQWTRRCVIIWVKWKAIFYLWSIYGLFLSNNMSMKSEWLLKVITDLHKNSTFKGTRSLKNWCSNCPLSGQPVSKTLITITAAAPWMSKRQVTSSRWWLLPQTCIGSGRLETLKQQMKLMNKWRTAFALTEQCSLCSPSADEPDNSDNSCLYEITTPQTFIMQRLPLVKLYQCWCRLSPLYKSCQLIIFSITLACAVLTPTVWASSLYRVSWLPLSYDRHSTCKRCGYAREMQEKTPTPLRTAVHVELQEPCNTFAVEVFLV